MQTFQQFLLIAPILLFSVIAHEIAHGWAALRQGDRTALDAGRLTWNPRPHIDPFFTILLPIMTIIGLQTGLLLSGAVLTETVFAWPGIGTWLVDAIRNRDYPVLQGGILFIAIVFVLVNLLVDLAYGLVNPRIRVS